MSSNINSPLTLFWFRKDLRLNDNHGLCRALKDTSNVLPVFIFDKHILYKIENKSDKRVAFIYDLVVNLKNELQEKYKSDLLVLYDKPLAAFEKLTKQYNIKAVYTNEDYEPYAIQRDNEVNTFLQIQSIDFKRFKDQVVFHPEEVLKNNQKPYTVFTPYKNAWLKKLNQTEVNTFSIEDLDKNFYSPSKSPMPNLGSLGFTHSDYQIVRPIIPDKLILSYHQTRDVPSLHGTSMLGPHLRFGTISIREAVKKAVQLNETWLNELIWREFFQMIIYWFPHSAQQNFKSQYDPVEWINSAIDFQAWCDGKTGFPLVDAGMRQLNETGYMHNRVRMVTAGFLTKHLLIDWRRGEQYFAERLMDYEPASNVGNWQWAAGTGCDAAPYFRVFNPYEQQKKFDPEFRYIKQWIPEFISPETYLKPITDHKTARLRAIETYKRALNRSKF